MTSQKDFDFDIKGNLRWIFPTLLSHTAEPYPTLPNMGENQSHTPIDVIIKILF